MSNKAEEYANDNSEYGDEMFKLYHAYNEGYRQAKEDKQFHQWPVFIFMGFVVAVIIDIVLVSLTGKHLTK